MRNYGSKRPHPARVAAYGVFVRDVLRPTSPPRSSLTLRLAEATPSQNETTGAHWNTIQRQRALWHGLLLQAIGDTRAWDCRHHNRKARVRIERVGKGTFDYGNLVGGCKVLIDRLVLRGLLVNDSPEWLTEEYDQRRCVKGEAPHTVVTITWETTP